MKISSSQVAGVLKSYMKQEATKTKESGLKPGIDKTDKTQLSSDAKLFQTAYKELKNMPDVRQERVDQAQQAIASGSYNVSGEEIADKILERSLVDKLV